MELTTVNQGGLEIHYRKGTTAEGSSDEHALKEVLEKKTYRRVRDDFDVKPGERWLDLGANIGAFALYCRLQGATAVCYEPDAECFKILKLNAPDFECVNAAVTAFKDKTLTFRTSDNPENRYRGTVIGGSVHVPDRYVECLPVSNVFIGKLAKGKFDGIKMDVEGSEGPIFDLEILPKTTKLVLEYHTSRDNSVANLKKRLRFLKSRFCNVRYPAAYDKAIADKLKTYQPRFDATVFCWEPK